MFVPGQGGYVRVTKKQNRCRSWCAPPDEAIWEIVGPEVTDRLNHDNDIRAQSQPTNAGLFSRKQRMFVCGPCFPFQDWSCELKMWRHSTLTFVSLVTDSLCVGLRVALWCWVPITWAAKITKQSDSGLCLDTVTWFRSPKSWHLV